MIPSGISALAGMLAPRGYHFSPFPKSWRAPDDIIDSMSAVSEYTAPNPAKQLSLQVAWRTVLLGGIYGFGLGALYAAAYTVVFFYFPFTSTGTYKDILDSLHHSIDEGIVYFLGSASFYSLGVVSGLLIVGGVGAGIGAFWGLILGPVETVVLLILTSRSFAARWIEQTYKWVTVGITLFVIGLVNLLVGLLFSTTNLFFSWLSFSLWFLPGSPNGDLLPGMWFLHVGLPALLATLAFAHISFLITGWVLKPPEERARSLF